MITVLFRSLQRGFLLTSLLTASLSLAQGPAVQSGQLGPLDLPSYQVEIVENPLSVDSLSESEKKFLDRHFESLRAYAENTMAELSAHEAHEIEHLFEQGSPQLKGRISAARAFVIRWWENVNFRRLFHNVHRAYHQDEKQQFRELMRDLICLWIPSHGTEVVGGVAAFLTTIFTFQPLEIIASTGLTALIISMPGFDPLCWILVGGYLISLTKIVFNFSSWGNAAQTVISPVVILGKIYAWLVRTIRTYVGRAALFGWKKTGLQRLAFRRYEFQTAHDYLLEDLIRRRESGVYDVRSVNERGSEPGAFEMRISELKENPNLEIRCLFRKNPDGSAALMRLQIDFERLEERISNILFSKFESSLREYVTRNARSVREQLRYLVMISGREEDNGIEQEKLREILDEYERSLRYEVQTAVSLVLKKWGIQPTSILNYFVGWPSRFLGRRRSGAHGTFRYSIVDMFRRREMMGDVFRYIKVQQEQESELLKEHGHEHKRGHKHSHTHGETLKPFYIQDVHAERGKLDVWFEPGAVHLKRKLRRRSRSGAIRSGGGRCAVFGG